MAVGVHGAAVDDEDEGRAVAAADRDRRVPIAGQVDVVTFHRPQPLRHHRGQGGPGRAVVEDRRRLDRHQAEVDVEAPGRVVAEHECQELADAHLPGRHASSIAPDDGRSPADRVANQSEAVGLGW